MIDRHQTWRSATKVNRVNFPLVHIWDYTAFYFPEDGLFIPNGQRSLKWKADEVAIVAFCLAEWDVNIESKIHS